VFRRGLDTPHGGHQRLEHSDAFVTLYGLIQPIEGFVLGEDLVADLVTNGLL
jgi:hypothetical protein